MTDFYSTRKSENIRWCVSKALVTPSAATLSLFEIPMHSLVFDVRLMVQTAGDSNTVTLGWSGNGETAVTNAFFTAAVANVLATGMKASARDTATSSDGKYFNAARGAITMTIGTTQGTGLFYVFCGYSVIHRD